MFACMFAEQEVLLLYALGELFSRNVRKVPDIGVLDYIILDQPEGHGIPSEVDGAGGFEAARKTHLASCFGANFSVVPLRPQVLRGFCRGSTWT